MASDKPKFYFSSGTYKNRRVWLVYVGETLWAFRKTDLELVYVDDVQTGEFEQYTTKEELAYTKNEKGFYKGTYKMVLSELKKYIKAQESKKTAKRRK